MKLQGWIVIVMIFCTEVVYAQEPDSADRVDIPVFEYQDSFSLSPISDGAMQAEEDIANGEPRLIICYDMGRNAFYATQKAFENKYGIMYKLYQCGDENDKCVKKYNKRVFQYLDKKFGRKWRRKVRKDVYGLK